MLPSGGLAGFGSFATGFDVVGLFGVLVLLVVAPPRKQQWRPEMFPKIIIIQTVRIRRSYLFKLTTQKIIRQ
jgi:hypothetical protein